MKKLFTLFAVALLAVVSAQAQLLVTHEGKEVKDGDVLTFEAGEAPFPGLDREAGGHDDPTFTATAAGTLRTYITVTKTYTGGYSKLLVCGITGSCTTFGKSKYLNLSRAMTAGQSVDMQFKAQFPDGQYGSYEAKVDVYFDEVKLMTFTSVFTCTESSGIESLSSAGAEGGVSFDGSVLHFSFPTAGTRSVGVYSTDGHLMKRAFVSAAGSLPLGGLQPGVYLYRVAGTDGKSASGKVTVK